jgi:hypothetical protein
MPEITMAQLSKSGVGAMGLAVLMLFFGGLMTGYGSEVSEWASQALSLSATCVLLLLSGLAMVVAALWIFGSLGRKQLPLRIGGVASLAAGIILPAAALTGIMQCSGPA